MASNVQLKCIAVLLKSGHATRACHLALLASIENGKSVYLPNAYALVSSHVTRAQWSGHLSALAKEGSYAPDADPAYVGFWGQIK